MAFSFVVVWFFECKPCQDTGKEWHLINAGSQKTEKKPNPNEPAMEAGSFRPTLFEHSKRQTRSDPAVAIPRLSITNYFKNTEKVF